MKRLFPLLLAVVALTVPVHADVIGFMGLTVSSWLTLLLFVILLIVAVVLLLK